MKWIRGGVVAFSLAAVVAGAGGSYVESVRKWREEREARLRSDTGWLAVAGLFWLKPGEQTIGSDEANRIMLPGKSVPRALGTIEFDGRRATLHYADAAKGSVELKPDTSGAPAMIKTGEITFWVIRRGDRFGVRVRDPESKIRREFTGCKWYPVKPAFRTVAKWLEDPKTLSIPSIIGVPEESESPGYAEFALGGKTIRLRASSGGEEYEFMFRDATSGRETYGGGRFLDAAPPRDGGIVLDFNKAYNPPCAFIPYATCPLPIRENRLKVAIPAGEKSYGSH